MLIMLTAILSSLRPKQWIKNLLIFAPLIFSNSFTDPVETNLAITAFAIFCLATSGVYLLNDVFDRQSDRKHPSKRHRPVASGKLPSNVAALVAAILLIAAIGSSFLLNSTLVLIVNGYIILQIAYSFFLKHVAIVDLLTVAAGFVLRVFVGAAAIAVSVSSWLLAITFLLALLLAAGKRSRELRHEKSHKHRKVLANYSPAFLSSTIKVILPAVLVSYLFYTFQSGRSIYFIFTVPFVVYGLLRYALLLESDSAEENPTDLLFTDKPLLTSVILWIGAVIVILSLT